MGNTYNRVYIRCCKYGENRYCEKCANKKLCASKHTGLLNSCLGKLCLHPYLVVPLRSTRVTLISTRVSAHCQAILLLMYSELCKIHIITSPITSIIAQSQPSKLDRFQLADANFPVLPDLGDKLSGQLRFCSLNSDGISTILNDAFIHYIHLVSLSLSGNPIKSLNSSMMNGLRHLKQLYLDNTHVSPLPEVDEWASELIKLSVSSLGLTELSIAILVNLPILKILQIRDNNLTTMPDKQYFVNLDSMVSIDIKQNQLVCDQRLCWLKVILKFTRLLWPSI